MQPWVTDCNILWDLFKGEIDSLLAHLSCQNETLSPQRKVHNNLSTEGKIMITLRFTQNLTPSDQNIPLSVLTLRGQRTQMGVMFCGVGLFSDEHWVGWLNSVSVVPEFCLVFPPPVGVICAAPAVEGAWWRAQVITFYKDSDEVEIRYVDYGGYDRVKIDSLRQIRWVADFTWQDDQGWQFESCV